MCERVRWCVCVIERVGGRDSAPVSVCVRDRWGEGVREADREKKFCLLTNDLSINLIVYIMHLLSLLLLT